MTTALQIINRAAELIGYKDPDETLNGNDASNFLGVLNSMVDAWALDSLFVYAITYLTQTVIGNPITIGDGQTLDVERPVRIPAGGFFRISGADYGFQMIGREEYAEWSRKTLTSRFPQVCYYQPTSPAGSLYFYPALNGSAELHLPIEQRLTAFADLSTDYTLLPGYRQALEFSLADELQPGRRPDNPSITRRAMTARRNIRRANVTPLELVTELVPVSTPSILRPA